MTSVDFNMTQMKPNFTQPNNKLLNKRSTQAINSKGKFYTKPIFAYKMPVQADHTTQVAPNDGAVASTSMTNVAEGATAGETASTTKPNVITATQRRFPLRDTHTVHIKRRLDANPSLAAIALTKEDSIGGSKKNILASRMQRDGS